MRYRFLWAAALLLLPGVAQAFPVLNYNREFSGATPPAGSAPWLVATFSDSGTNQVDLVFSASGLVGSEFVSEVGFNLADEFFDTDKNPIAGLSASVVDATGTFTNPTISFKKDDFKADGDGYFDISLGFATSEANKFGAGESVTIRFSYTGSAAGVSLTVADFNYLSVGGDAGKTALISAAHVQGIGDDGNKSGWVTPTAIVPEPSALAIAGLGALGFLGYGLRRRFRG